MHYVLLALDVAPVLVESGAGCIWRFIICRDVFVMLRDFSGSRCKLKLEFRRATFVLVGVVSTDAVNPRDALVRAHHSAHLLYPVHYILPCLRLSSLFPVVLSVPVVLRLV